MKGTVSFRGIIELWSDVDAMASDIGAGREAVRKWRERDRIPPEWWQSILDSDVGKSAGVDAAMLTSLAAREAADARS